MKYIVLALSLMSGLAYAGDVNFSWTQELKREDGTPMDASEISKYVLYVKTSSGYAKYAEFPPTATTGKVPQFTGTKLFVLRTVDLNGIESQDSTVAKVSFSAPNAPVLSVKVTLTP